MIEVVGMAAGIAKKVLIATNDPFAESARDEAVKLLADAGCIVEVLEKYGDKKALLEKVRDANVIIVRSDLVDQEVVDAAPNLELIVRGGSGVDNVNVNFDELREKGIYVMNTPGMNSAAVAEHVLASSSSALRKIITAHNSLVLEKIRKDSLPESESMLSILDRIVKESKTSKQAEYFANGFVRGFAEALDIVQKHLAFPSGSSIKKQSTGQELGGKKIGIYGFGYIGQIVAQIANGFGMDVCTFDPFVSEAVASDKGARMVKTLDELCSGAFMLTLHVSLNKDTKESVNYDVLSRMAKDGIVINAARDDIIHKESIAKILAENPDFKCVTDFGEKNVDLVMRFPGRVIITPHIGASTFEANNRTIVAAARQVIGFYIKDDDSCVLNRDVVPHYLKNYAELAFRLGLLARAFVHGSVLKVATVCYSDLYPFSKAFTEKIVKGMLAGENDSDIRPEDFKAYSRNIETIIKDPDKTKGYGNSITADIFTQNGKFSSVSIRGTMSENNPVLARVEDFHNLYFAPEGMVAFFMYNDRPGKMDMIGRYFTERGYNKSNIRAAQSKDKKRALAIIQIEKNDEPNKMCTELSAIVSRVLTEDHDVYHAAFVNFG